MTAARPMTGVRTGMAARNALLRNEVSKPGPKVGNLQGQSGKAPTRRYSDANKKFTVAPLESPRIFAPV